eukprot:CAMPEP_0172554782 /NCGR_PEP_ID=MMETSP1067-20121228/56428_1 /TAXON_ID=265564 ORGANISM="Thalassiosira punctigera, Strain Tpunct2005C2" /NCGR_SAMPLE_ID=MMETSP1067 /ASSEMBLY_ACC=CAM_ASM_000444 /LENGTH=569 /DNA_ID=CAMNT_0013343223 /DNA_START=15 /DNA_END=1724 /DNA_ORIENTATION=+
MIFFLFLTSIAIIFHIGTLAFSPSPWTAATWKFRRGGYSAGEILRQSGGNWGDDPWSDEEYYDSPRYYADGQPERPFQRANDSYWSSRSYSSPNSSRRDLWNNDQQRDYRKNKFNRDPQWPQRQSYSEGRESRYYGEGENYYYSDSGDSASYDGGGGSRKYTNTKDFRQKSSLSSPPSQAFGKEIGRDLSNDELDYFDQTWQQKNIQTEPQWGDDYYDRQISPQPGSNIGELYTENLRQGSGSGRGRYNYSKNDSQRQSFRKNGNFKRETPFDDQRLGSYQNEATNLGRNVSKVEANTRGDRGKYYNEPPRAPSQSPPLAQQFENGNEFGRTREQQQMEWQYGYTVGRSFDQRQARSSTNADFFDGGQRQNMFDRTARPQFDVNESQIKKQYESPPQYPKEQGKVNFMRDDSSVGFGYGSIRRMVDQFMSPFGVFGKMDQMMERVDSEMRRSMAQEQKSTKSLLTNARDSLLADPAVRTTIGDSITLGKPFSQLSSKTMVNGVTRSRLQLVIPISGSKGTGRVRLVANQDTIMLLEVGIGGRVIRVPLDEQRRRSEDVIDANVEDKEIY